ncbi:MAG: BolA family protein [Sterolibacterium sp.]
MNAIEKIRQSLASLGPEQVEIADDSALHAGHAGAKDGGGHYRLTIVSRRFAGLNTMQRHRLVYTALGTLMKSEIHALSINARAPDEA